MDNWTKLYWRMFWPQIFGRLIWRSALLVLVLVAIWRLLP